MESVEIHRVVQNACMSASQPLKLVLFLTWYTKLNCFVVCWLQWMETKEIKRQLLALWTVFELTREFFLLPLQFFAYARFGFKQCFSCQKGVSQNGILTANSYWAASWHSEKLASHVRGHSTLNHFQPVAGFPVQSLKMGAVGFPITGFVGLMESHIGKRFDPNSLLWWKKIMHVITTHNSTQYLRLAECLHFLQVWCSRGKVWGSGSGTWWVLWYMGGWSWGKWVARSPVFTTGPHGMVNAGWLFNCCWLALEIWEPLGIKTVLQFMKLLCPLEIRA